MPDSSSGASAPAALCSRLSAERGLPLIGSAGCYQSVIVFELDSPWTPRLIASRAGDAELDAVIERIGTHARNVRLLAVEPRQAVRDGARRLSNRVLHYSKGQGPFAAFSCREYLVARDDLASSLDRLAAGDGIEAQEVERAGGLRDILVCTHGARDACCGKFGYRLFLEFAALAGGHAASQLRVWRSSHLGGHRFAPTMLDLPSGRMFGRLADGDAALVVGGGAALVSRLFTIYRGRCALPEGAQIVERELWCRTGPDFEPATLSWQIEADGDAWNVRLDAECAGAGSLHIAAQVIRAQVDAVCTPASCGRDPEEEAPWRILA